MKRLALFLLCIAMPATVSAQAPAAQTSAAEGPQQPATEVVATNWSLKPKAGKIAVKGKQGVAAKPAQVRRVQTAQPRITGGARARNGRGSAKVGVKLPF